MEPVITYHFVWGPMRAKACLRGEAAERLDALIRETVRSLSIDLEDVMILPDRVYVAVEALGVAMPVEVVTRSGDERHLPALGAQAACERPCCMGGAAAGIEQDGGEDAPRHQPGTIFAEGLPALRRRWPG